MKAQTLPLEKSGHFSKLFLDYLQHAPGLKPFYGQLPRAESFRQQIEEKQFPAEKRQLLHQVLHTQYQGLPKIAAVEENLQAITEPATFTITTGHQLNIFTGPLYFIYKIAATIRACQELQAHYPQHRFVPLYWMASEDHDLAEIDHFRLFGQTYRWQTEQTGPVGRFSTDGLAALSQELPETVPLFEQAYAQEATLAAATRRFVHELFGQWGLLVLDADHPQLKKEFASVVKEELLEQRSQGLVQQASSGLEALGYSAQIHPREINLFYMQNEFRERLVQEGDQWVVLHTNLRFKKQELLDEVENHPERFSPNVVLRPLYQEWILPNLAYVGGPAEVAYWLQLKPLFDHYQLPFPILLPRQFALVLNKAQEQRRQKLNLKMEELFEDPHQLKSRLLDVWSGHEISLEEERQQLQHFFNTLQEKAAAIDKSLRGFVGAESAKAEKSLENIEKRLKKAEEQRHSTQMQQLEGLLEKLFPGGSLQERTDNFLNFYLNDPQFIERLLPHLSGFDFSLKVLSYEN
jgi:bacillithiol synthase